MPYNGSGKFIPLPSPTFPALPGTLIYADAWNAVVLDIMEGLSQAYPRNGESGLTANLNLNGFTLANLKRAAQVGEPVEYEQWIQGFATPNMEKPTVGVIEDLAPGNRVASLGWTQSYVSAQITPLAQQLQQLTQAGQTSIYGVRAGDTWTGQHDFRTATLRATTQSVADNSDKVATTAYVTAKSFASSLPVQGANAGKFLKTNGTSASWEKLTAADIPELNMPSSGGIKAVQRGVTVPGHPVWVEQYINVSPFDPGKTTIDLLSSSQGVDPGEMRVRIVSSGVIGIVSYMRDANGYYPVNCSWELTEYL